MRLITFVCIASTLGLAVSVAAHDVVKGANGGQVVDDAGHHVEFTTKGDEIVLFLSDSADVPIASTKAAGRVIIQAAGKQSTAELTAVEPNILSAKLAVPVPAGAKLAVTIKLGDGHDVKARFVAR